MDFFFEAPLATLKDDVPGANGLLLWTGYVVTAWGCLTLSGVFQLGVGEGYNMYKS